MTLLVANEVLSGPREYDCHTVEENGLWRYPVHRHVDCCDLTYLHRGSLVQIVNGSRAVIREGMVTLVRPGDVHRVWGRDLVMFNLNFRPESLRRAAAYLGMEHAVGMLFDAPSAPVFEPTPTLRSSILFDVQELLYGQRAADAASSFRSFLVRWIHAVLRTSRTDPLRDTPAWVSDLLDYIERNVELPVEVADLRRVSGKSGEHIARCFRAYIGVTPSAAINAARLRHAALLLAHTNREILDICYALGFNSASYFYRLFGAQFGVTPRRYRKEHWFQSVASR